MDAHPIDSAISVICGVPASCRGSSPRRARLDLVGRPVIALAEAQADVGHHPRLAGGRDRRPCPSRPARSGLRRRRRPGHVALDARPDPGLQRILPADGARARLLRRDRPGRHGHLRSWRSLRSPGYRLAGPAGRSRTDSWLLPSEHRDDADGWSYARPARAPITFGFKAASWADEVGRHLERFAGPRPLARGPARRCGRRTRVLRRAGDPAACGVLRRARSRGPGHLWLTARDRLAEFARCWPPISGDPGPDRQRGLRACQGRDRRAARAAPTAARSAASPCRTSATPRCSEQLVTLARLVRSSAGVLAEATIGEHERDGRSWKTEWVVLPEVASTRGRGRDDAVPGGGPGGRPRADAREPGQPR